jgi:hypothetical protein
MRHETTHLYSTVDLRGTSIAASRAALLRGLHPAALPDPAGQCARTTPRSDCPAAELCDPERAQCSPCLPPPGVGIRARPIAASQTHPPRARARTVAGAAARAAPRLWQTPQYLDAPFGRRGLLGTGSDPVPSQHRDHPPSAQAVGRQLAAGQALDHQPRSPVCVKKKPRDRLIHLAGQHPDWVLGFADETWWSRLAHPALHSWTAGEPLRLIEQVLPKGDVEPKALCG